MSCSVLRTTFLIDALFLSCQGKECIMILKIFRPNRSISDLGMLKIFLLLFEQSLCLKACLAYFRQYEYQIQQSILNVILTYISIYIQPIYILIQILFYLFNILKSVFIFNHRAPLFYKLFIIFEFL
jgi:hypothetical protein